MGSDELRFKNLKRKGRTPTETPDNRRRARIVLAFIVTGVALALVGILLAVLL